MDSQDKPVRRRANELEVQTRTKDVVKMLLDLNNNTEIRDMLKEKYNLEEHSANNYIKKAHAEIKQHHKPQITTIVNSHVKKYKDIARRNEMDDPRTTILSMQALERLLRLTGSGEGKQFNQQVNINLENVETEEIMSLLQSITKPDNPDVIEITEE